MLRIMLSSTILALVAAPLVAQGVTYGSAGLGYSKVSPDSDDFSSTVFDGDIEFTYDQFVFGGSLLTQKFEVFSDDDRITLLSGFAGYAPMPEVLVGAGLTRLDFDTGFGDALNGYEVFAQYRTPMFGGAIVYAVPDNDEDDFTVTSFFGEAEFVPGFSVGAIVDNFSEIDENIYYLSADYMQGPVMVRGYYSGVSGEDFAIYGARGSYDIGNGFSVLASLGGFEDFLADEGEVYSIGAEYEFAPGASLDASVGRLSVDGDDADVFQIGLSFDVGAPTRLDTKMTSALREDRKNGLGAIIPDIGIGGAGFGLF